MLLTVDRAVTVLRIFRGDQEWWGLREISRLLDLNPATTHQILYTLERHELLEKNPETRKYRLGLGTVQLAGTKLAQMDVIKIATPIMADLMEETGETVALSTLFNGSALYLARTESKHTVRVSSQIGAHAPLHCSANGKALLAWQDEEVLTSLLGEHFVRYTPRTLSDMDSLRANLREARERGYAVDREEYLPQVRGVAAPSFNFAGKMEASLGVVGPAERMAEKTLQRHADATRRAAGRISAGLGWRGYS